MFIKPEEAVDNFGLMPGMTVADFGSGSGYYTIAAAKLVGPSGAVYSVDIQKNLLAAVKSAAELNHLSNVEIVWADLEKESGSHLASASVDFVIISNILFQAENREAVAKEAFRILKENGKAAIIEWSDEDIGKIGPVKEKRLPEEEAKKIFLSDGFLLDRKIPAGENHYGLLFKKK